MATARNSEPSRIESTEKDFYLPASSVSSALDTVESVLSKVIGRHGVVLIPDTYNK
ncbi:hypothetical protein [Halobellus sp. GM3]|uniref:hypothetical protein n=1 Tax=Halobellus sp. GM3 TaxID=3458410 RepID=UPI00403E2CD7